MARVELGGAHFLAALYIVGSFLREGCFKLLGNNIGDKGAAAIANAIRDNTTLTSLDLSDSFERIGPTGALTIGEAVRGKTSLTRLCLCSHNRNLREGLKSNVLDLSETTCCVANAFLYLSISTALTSINLSGKGLFDGSANRLGHDGATAAAVALRALTKLTALDLGGGALHVGLTREGATSAMRGPRPSPLPSKASRG